MTPTDHPLQDGSFDPLALLRRSRGDDDLRDIKLRLLWLRQREPDARVTTEVVSLDERAVVMGLGLLGQLTVQPHLQPVFQGPRPQD